MLKLEVGKKYLAHDGQTIEIVNYNPNESATYPFLGSNGSSYTEAGEFFAGVSGSFALISEVEVSETPKEKIPVWKKNNQKFPWGGWLSDLVDPDEQKQKQKSGNGNGQGEGDGSDKGHSNGSGQGSGGGGGDNKPQPGDGKPGDGKGSGSPGGNEEGKDPGDEYYGPEHLGYEERDVGGHKIFQFESLEAFINKADDREHSRSQWQHRTSRRAGDGDWAGAKTFDEAIDQARYGWDDGVVRMNQIAEFYHSTNKWHIDKARFLDVGGSYPIVPVWLGGDPACMVDDGSMYQRPKPILHIIVNRTNNYTISAESIFNFGAALMVCVDQIETAGTSVEIDVVTTSYGTRSQTLITDTKIKRPGDHLEKNRLAYAMANPGYLRRLEFSVLEQIAEYEPMFRGTYGRAIELPENFRAPNALYIPILEGFGKSTTWTDIKKSVSFMQQFLGVDVGDDGQIILNKQREAA